MSKSNLQKGQVQSLTTGVGDLIHVERGILWLTITGESNDILLRRGESWRASRAGKVVVQALQHAAFEQRGQATESRVKTWDSLLKPIRWRSLLGF
jgi:hypothetical protein